MHSLYNVPLSRQPSTITVPKHDRLMARYETNIAKVIKHYRGARNSVKASHLLVQVIQTLPSGRTLNIKDYAEIINDYTDDLTRVFGFTSSINSGKFFSPGIFLGKDSDEVIIIKNEPFDLELAEIDWEDLNPIRYLSHPKSDMSLTIPTGNGYSDEKGVSVLTLDLVKLAVQYRLWRKRQHILFDGAEQTTMQFIAGYVLPNLLSSFSEVVYLNILTKLFSGEDLNNVDEKHPFYLNTYYDEIVNSTSNVLYTYLNRNISFNEYLEVSRGISNDSLRDTIKLPRMIVNRQVEWPLSISRLKVISMMLLWTARTRSGQNKQDINIIKRAIKRLKSDKSLESLGSNRATKIVRRQLEEDIIELL